MFDTMRRLVAGITVTLILGLAYGSAAPRARHPLSLMHEFDVAAAVAFDGKTETLIVTAKLTSDGITDLTWVIPIQSNQKPVVELVKADVLHELYWILQGFDSRQVWSGGDMGGEALVSRLLEMHDPQTYSAHVLGPGTAAVEGWLQEYDVRQETVPEGSRADRTPEDTFFVGVHVGLAGLYGEDVDYVLKQQWLDDRQEFPDKIQTALSSLYKRPYDQVTRDVLLKQPYEQSALSQDPLHREYTLLTRDEYDELVRQYGIGEEILLKTFRFDSRPPTFIDIWFKSDYREITFWNGRERGVVVFKKDSGSNLKWYGRHSDEPVYSAAELEEVRAFFQKYGPLVGKKSSELSEKLLRRFWDHPSVQPFARLRDLLSDLKSGIPIALKISFATREAYIPAGITHGRSGTTRFTAYVFGSEPMKDGGGHLEITKWQTIGTAMKAKLSRYLPVYDARVMSMLTSSGAPSDLSTEIRFTQMDEDERASYSEQGRARARMKDEELEGAVRRTDLDRIKDLVAEGAKIEGDRGGNLIHQVIEYARDGKAARQTITYLMDNGANINTQNVLGQTPLYCILETSRGPLAETYVKIIEDLIDNGGSLAGKKIPRAGSELLAAAAEVGNMKVLEFLVRNGADVNSGSHMSPNALHVASQAGRTEIARFLIEHDADVDRYSVVESHYQRPIDLAVQHGHAAVVELLLRSGADYAKSRLGVSGPEPLSVAAQEGHLNVVQAFLRHGANVNGTNRSGLTPLWCAAKTGQKDMVRFLLEAGADPTITFAGRSPLDLATESGHLDVADLIREHQHKRGPSGQEQ